MSFEMKDAKILEEPRFVLGMALNNSQLNSFAKAKFENTMAWAVYRSFAAVYFFAILIWSITATSVGVNADYWFIYLTNWTLLWEVIYLCLACACTWKYGFDKGTLRETPALFTVTWVFQNIAMGATFIVCVLYWVLVYSGGTVFVLGVHVHGINWIMMLIDRFLTRQPIYYSHVYQPMIYALVYSIWSIIHSYSGIDNGSRKGTYIYTSTDFKGNPFSFIIVTIVVFIVAPLFHTIMVGWARLADWVWSDALPTRRVGDSNL